MKRTESNVCERARANGHGRAREASQHQLGEGAHALIINELEWKSRLLGDVIHGEYGVA
jgi:hypothetical protein